MRQRPQLPVERAQRRISAFVYGNITVLGAVAATDSDPDHSGTAVLVVLVTALTTFVAHLLAERVGESLAGEEHHDAEAWSAQVRDATPIASAGTVPAVLLALAWWDVLDPELAQLLAAGVIVLRLAATGPVVSRLAGRRPTAAARWGGIGLAVLGAVIATVKAVLGH